MPRKGHTEEQILYALRQIEGGKKVIEVCREMGVTPQAVYRWRRRYGRLGLNEARELRQLREENRKLKGSWRTSRWISTSCRRCSQKSIEARKAS